MMTTTTIANNVPALDEDPWSDETLLNPYPMHERLREAGPVTFLPRYGVYAVARYEQIVEVASNWETFSSAAGVGLQDPRDPAYFRNPGPLLESDPPDHTRVRKLFSPLVSAPSLKRLRETATPTASALVDAVLAAGPDIDGVRELALAFPMRVLPDAVGMPKEGRENLIPYGELTFNGIGPENELFHKALAAAGDAQVWIADAMKRENLAPDGMGAMLYTFVDSGDITEDQAGRLVRTFLGAGIDTTVSAIGGALMLFAQNPEQWEKVRENRALIRPAFDEVIRVISPAQTFARLATHDTTIGGQDITADSRIVLFYGAGNRDPRRWDRPEEFDIERRTTGHLGFGHGIHGCAGQMVARLEAELLFNALADRVHSIELTGTPTWHLNNTLRSLEELPIRLHTDGNG